MGWSMRFINTMLLMLVLSLFQFVFDAPASAMSEAKEKRQCLATVVCCKHTVVIGDAFGSFPGGAGQGAARSGHAPVSTGVPNSTGSVVARLQPGIFLIPRKDRVPKPKSVYRLFTRAPGPATPIL